MILAAIEPNGSATQIAVLYGAISAMTTALVFLFNRITRSEARLQKALKDEAEKCESEKVRMFEFSTKLIEYITALTKVTCTSMECPLRRLIPPAPQPGPEDMGLRPQKK